MYLTEFDFTDLFTFFAEINFFPSYSFFQGTLSFALNGKDLGVAASGLNNRVPLYASFSLYNEGDQLSVVMVRVSAVCQNQNQGQSQIQGQGISDIISVSPAGRETNSIASTHQTPHQMELISQPSLVPAIHPLGLSNTQITSQKSQIPSQSRLLPSQTLLQAGVGAVGVGVGFGVGLGVGITAGSGSGTVTGIGASKVGMIPYPHISQNASGAERLLERYLLSLISS